MSIPRLDGRLYNQIRPYSVEYGISNENLAVGSARLQQGLTELIAIVYGPITPRYSRHELFDRASFEVNINFTECSIDNIKAMRNFLASAVKNCIDLDKYPRMLIYIRIEVIIDDGSLLSTAFNACIIALIDSGISLKSTPVASSIILYQFPSNSKLVDNYEIFLDPTKEEEINSISKIMIVSQSSGVYLKSEDKVSEDNKEDEIIVTTQIVGSVNVDALIQANELAFKCSKKFREFIRNLFYNND